MPETGRTAGAARRYACARARHVVNLVLLLGWTVSLLPGCGTSRRPIRVDPDPATQVPDRSVLAFFVDGMDHAVTYRMLDAGRLPNIQRVFVDGGVGVEHAVCSFPSVTFPSFSTIFTGRFPSHHGILGNFWFDRVSLECRYYMSDLRYATVNDHLGHTTVFDAIDDEYTVNVQGHTYKGATETIANGIRFSVRWFIGLDESADRCVGLALESVAARANARGRWPVLVTMYFSSVDKIGHEQGPDSEAYADSLVNVDGIIGRVVDALERAGLHERICYVLASDHGMAPVHEDRVTDIVGWLEKYRGMRIRTSRIDAKSFERRRDLMAGYHAVVSVDGGRLALIHLRCGADWSARPSHDDVNALFQQSPPLMAVPGLELALIRRGPNLVRVVSPQGEMADLQRRIDADGTRQYSAVIHEKAGSHAAALLWTGDETWRSSREWLQATAASEYPDFVPQALDLFDSDRAGDVVLFAREGWAFVTGFRGAHGSCLAQDMKVPMFFSGPDLPAGRTIPSARLADLAPTILGLLGREDRISRLGDIDGVDLSPMMSSSQITPAH